MSAICMAELLKQTSSPPNVCAPRCSGVWSGDYVGRSRTLCVWLREAEAPLTVQRERAAEPPSLYIYSLIWAHMQPQKTTTVSSLIHAIISCLVRPKWKTLLTTNTLFFFEGHWGHEESASSDRVKDGSC